MFREERKDVGQPGRETENHGQDSEPVKSNLVRKIFPQRTGIWYATSDIERVVQAIVSRLAHSRLTIVRRYLSLWLALMRFQPQLVSVVRKGNILKFRVWNSSLSVILADYGRS